ncbi:MAG: hypothetical protein ACP5MZ_03200 [Candidatus Micrarchaeia archaeon]
MEDYTVVEHRVHKEEKEGEYIIVALNYVLPTYIKATSKQILQKGEVVQLDDDKLFYKGELMGKLLTKRLGSDIKISTDYDIKYTGGYSNDGKTIYIDRNFPKSLNVNGKEVSTLESIGRHHELTEKWLTDDAYEYPYAHEIADGVEKLYVESLGIDWKAYSDEVGKHLHDTYARKLQKSPKDLDLSPYIYSHDNKAIEEIRESTDPL